MTGELSRLEDKERALAVEDGGESRKRRGMKYEHHPKGERSAHAIGAKDARKDSLYEGDDEGADTDDEKHAGECREGEKQSSCTRPDSGKWDGCC